MRRGTLNARIARAGGALPGLVIEALAASLMQQISSVAASSFGFGF
jgi:hypothetical protein